MNVLITGAAGNLGSLLAKYMLGGPHHLRLMTHRKDVLPELSESPQAEVCRADLARPDTLAAACAGIDCIVHFAGILFAPGPKKFLPVTNVEYVRNLVNAAIAASVGKFIIVSFPHVEGASTPENPATGRPHGTPDSVHARTRLEAEKVLFFACENKSMIPVALRPGMIYAKGILMIDAAQWLARRRILAVWPRPTHIHLISLPDFNACVVAAIEEENVKGIYNLGDDGPLTLQEFLDAASTHWGCRKPWRLPRWSFFAAGWLCEAFARIFGTASPLTRDFIRIGMASYFSDTTRMKNQLLPQLEFPTLKHGMHLLERFDT